jgi:multicomponent K+:H+ antiporter subunit C
VMGRWKTAAAPIVEKAGATLADTADPLPQALVLTAIVISFAMTALLLALAVRTHLATGSDHVDGEEREPAS